MWLGYALACGALGLLLGWEASSYGNKPRYAGSNPGLVRYFMFAMLALSIAGQVGTIRGFFVVFLSALGAYYFSKPIGQLLERKYWSIRSKSPTITLLDCRQNPSKRALYFDMSGMPGATVETIFFRHDRDRTVRIKEAEQDGRILHVSSNGWIEPKGLILPRNGFATIEISLADWSLAKSFRVIGQWDNGVFWIVDNEVC